MGITNEKSVRKTVLRTLELIRLKKQEIYSIYFFSAMYGLLLLSIPVGVQMIINFIQAYTYSTSLWVLIFLVLVGVLLSGVLQVIQMKIIERVNQKIFSRYGLEYAFRIPRLDMKSIDEYYLPELINRFFDTVSVQKGLAKLLIDIPIATIQIIFGVILLSLYSSVFIIFGLLLLVTLVLIIYFTSRRGINTNLEESNYKYEVAGWLEEMARAFRTFKFSIDANIHLKQSDELVSKYLDARTRHFKVLLSQYWSLIGFKTLIAAGMLIVGTVLAINNQINIGQFVAAEIVILMMMNSVEKFIYSLDTFYDVITSVEKLGKVLDKPLEKNGTMRFEPGPVGVDVKVKDLSFGFGDKQQVLQDVSLHVPAGYKVCIMGNEGAGKSMLLRMLTGAYSDYTGSVLVNDVPVTNYELRSLHEHTGIILNDQDIFSGSLLHNITLGNPEISLQDVTRLASVIEFDDHVPRLSDGYNTILVSTGSRLSKAAVQKILLMRALIHQPHLLLMENPWNALDKDNQQNIQDYILNRLPNTTALIASNDEAFARKCHFVIMLNKGKVQAIGKAQDVIHLLN